jgi:hypothetical protein
MRLLSVYYRAFFALDFAHLARCAAAILARAAAESFRLPLPSPDVPATPLNASIAFQPRTLCLQLRYYRTYVSHSYSLSYRGRFDCNFHHTEANPRTPFVYATGSEESVTGVTTV